MERLVQFTFLGQKYKIYTGIGEEEMEDILHFLKQTEAELLPAGRGSLPAGKAGVMACLNIASQYVRLQREHDQYRTEMKQRINLLNRRISSDLFEENNRQDR